MTCLASDEFLTCTRCELHKYRTQVVPGHGSCNARIAFVAEAPGEAEDRQGLPLIGPAGQRFTRQLETVGLQRKDVFLDNAVHCRPPDNDLTRFPDALVRCPDLWLHPVLAALPHLRAVVAMGATSGGLWLGGGYKVGQMVELARMVSGGLSGGYVVVPSYHPSHALRKGGEWNDIDESIVESMRRAMTYAAMIEMQQ